MFHTSEQELIDALLLRAWFDEVRAGRRVEASAQATAWIDQAIAAGLPFARTDAGERRFDAELAMRFLRERGLDGRDRLWHDRVLPRRRREFEALADASAHEGIAARRITLVFERLTMRDDLEPGRPTKIAMPLPEEEPTQRDIVVEPLDEPGARHRREPGALLRVGVVPDDCVVRVGARIGFTAAGRAYTLDRAPPSFSGAADGALAPYLAPLEGMLRVTPAIRELAGSLRRDDALGTLRAFWDFAFDRLLIGPVCYDELDAGDPLSSAIAGRWVDCFVVSSLLGALCRVVGIPARLVSGVLLVSSGLGPHYWLEAWLPPHGWVPFDFYASELAAGDKRDERWAMSMFGRLPPQLVFHRLPQPQVMLGLRLPPAWSSLQRLDEDGAVTTPFCDRTTGALVCADRFERLDDKIETGQGGSRLIGL